MSARNIGGPAQRDLSAIYGSSEAARARLGWKRITTEQARFALALVDSTDLPEQLERWRRLDAPPKSNAGAPRQLHDRQILALFVLAAVDKMPLLIQSLADMVEHRLDPGAQLLLGIRSDNTQRTGEGREWYMRIWNALRRILKVVDALPGPRKRALWSHEIKAVENERKKNEHQNTVRAMRFDILTNTVIQMSLNLLPKEARDAWDGTTTIDATFVRPNTRRRKAWKNAKYDLLVMEYDAGIYSRKKKADKRDSNKTQYPDAEVGWELTIPMMVPGLEWNGIPAFPQLAVGLSMEVPGVQPGTMMMRAIDSVLDRGYPAGLWVADRAYWAGQKVEKLHYPARARGIGVVTDYRKDQLGLRGGYGGARQVEGALYCPGMPKALADATKQLRDKQIDITTYQQRIEERRDYRLQRKEKPDDEGRTPMKCPASGDNPTVSCPLKPRRYGDSPRIDKKLMGKPDIAEENLPEIPGIVCTNKSSISVPHDFPGSKFMQDLHFGSEEWHEMYSRNRQTMEGFNGYIKHGAKGQLKDPTRRLLRGFTAQLFIIAFLIMNANLLLLDAWLLRPATPPASRGPRRAGLSRFRKRRDLDPWLEANDESGVTVETDLPDDPDIPDELYDEHDLAT